MVTLKPYLNSKSCRKYLATTDIATAKASPKVFAARRDKTK
uniref:Uncharacterized protein n=1 Tax=Podoviridae sp. ctrya9 TaxID=2825280 RepID=A0A8S5P6V6_9CAUD|nr:MAG TPA: hypothetical protein [Podoviridae sp. ctrya9]